MASNYNDIEKLYLTEEENEFIKHTIINPDVKKAETKNWLGWRGILEIKVLLKKTTNPIDVEQYLRLREIEFLFTILQDEYCKSIIDLSEKIDLMDEIEKEFHTKVMLEYTMLEIEDAFDKKTLEKILEEKYDQNLEEPFVQDLINELVKDKAKEQEFLKLERLIKAAEFKYIDDKTLLSIATLLLKEYEKAAQNNQNLFIKRHNLEKSTCIFLMLKNLKHAPIILGDNNSHKKK